MGWTYLRLGLGLAQMAGSFAAVLLFVLNGLIPAVWWVTAATGVVTLTSMVLFRVLRVDK